MPVSTHPRDTLYAPLSKVFDQAQNSTANHQKNYIALYKLQISAAEYTETVRNSDNVKLSGERTFEDMFLDMVNRVLSVKKGVAPADRIVKFVSGYVKNLNDKSAFLLYLWFSHPYRIGQLWKFSKPRAWTTMKIRLLHGSRRACSNTCSRPLSRRTK